MSKIIKHKNTYINSFKDAIVGNGYKESTITVDSSSPYYLEIAEENEVGSFAYDLGRVVVDNLKVSGGGGTDNSHDHDNRYAKIDHNHDSIYAKIVHNHDDRYYTKTQTDEWRNNLINGNLLFNKINANHIQAGTIVSGSSIIANGAIGNAQINKVSADKLDAGVIDTSNITISGANGNLKLKGNRLQVFEGIGSSQFERVSLGDVDNNGSIYGLRVRGKDGETVLYDENGIYREGITDGSINNDKIGDDANINGGKLNINSVIDRINEDGTGTIHGTKIDIDGESVSSKVFQIELSQNEHSETMKRQQSEINQNKENINLKVSNQKYTEDMSSMTSRLDKTESDINVLNDSISLTVKKSELENQINEVKDFVSNEIGDISVGGANYINNSAPRKANLVDILIWDKTLNGSHRLAYWQDYNDLVASPTIGYHPHIDLKTFHFPCIALINRNAIFGLANRELSLKQVISNEEGFITPNETYTISFDAYSDTSLFSFHGGLYHKNVESNSYNYHSGRMDIQISKDDINMWKRYSYTFTTHKGLDLNGELTLVINGHNNPEGSGYIKNIKLEKGNIPTQWTPSQFDVDDSLDDVVESMKDYTNSTIRDYSSSIDIELDSITSRVEVTEKGVNSVNQKYTEIKQTVDSIDITGKVSFSDLSTSGKTVINGANITSGYINGDRIKGGVISAANEINFIGGARIFGNQGAYGAGLMTSAQQYSFNSGEAYFENNLYAQKGFGVNGTTTLKGAVTCNSNITSSGTVKGSTLNGSSLSVSGQANVGSVVTNGLNVYGSTSLSGSLYATGATTLSSTLTTSGKIMASSGSVSAYNDTAMLGYYGWFSTAGSNCYAVKVSNSYLVGTSTGFHVCSGISSYGMLYAKNVSSSYSLDTVETISEVSALDKISEVNVINTSEGLRLSAPINRASLDESSVVTTSYNEKTNQEEVNVDYNSAIATLWKAVQELKEENEELKKLIKGDK